jgi:hypothetical protein
VTNLKQMQFTKRQFKQHKSLNFIFSKCSIETHDTKKIKQKQIFVFRRKSEKEKKRIKVLFSPHDAERMRKRRWKSQKKVTNTFRVRELLKAWHSKQALTDVFLTLPSYFFVLSMNELSK